MRTRLLLARLVSVAAAVMIILHQAPARAVETSVPDQPETCTIEKRQRAGEQCIACGAWDGDAAKCQKRLSSRGYERRCRGAGASRWSEIWCRPVGGRATPTAPRPSPAQSE